MSTATPTSARPTLPGFWHGWPRWKGRGRAGRWKRCKPSLAPGPRLRASPGGAGEGLRPFEPRKTRIPVKFAGGGRAPVPAVDRDRYQQRLNLPPRDVASDRVVEDPFECVPVPAPHCRAVSHCAADIRGHRSNPPPPRSGPRGWGGRGGMRVKLRSRSFISRAARSTSLSSRSGGVRRSRRSASRSPFR